MRAPSRDYWQVPPEHEVKPWAAQLFPQLPQFAGSLSRSAQRLEQHAGTVPVQTTPQLPQFAGSESRS